MADPTVVITGASGNLGRALAAAFGARNANLVLVQRLFQGVDGLRPGLRLVQKMRNGCASSAHPWE